MIESSLVWAQSKIELQQATYNWSMKCIVTRGQGSDEKWGEYLPQHSQHSEHIHYNWKSQMVQCQCGVHHGSCVKATQGHCVGKVNPSELLSQHGLNIWRTLSNQGLCWLISSHKMSFSLTTGNKYVKCVNVCWFLALLCSSINTVKDLEWKTWALTFWTASCVKYIQTKSPCKGSSPFPATVT